MHQDDFPGFKAVLVQLGEVYPKKITDDTVQAYWGALKDLSLATIIRLASQHAKYAKFFPKPVELRPKEDKPPLSDPKFDASFREGEERAIRTLEELRQRNPEAWLTQMGDNNAARLHRQFGEQLWYDLPNRCWRV